MKEHTRYILIFIPVYLSEVIIYFIYVYARAASKLQTRSCDRVNASCNLQNLFRNIFVDEFS